MSAARDAVVGTGLLVISGAAWFGLIPVGIDLPSNITIAALSPDFWPRIVIGILAVTGAVVALQAFLAMRGATLPPGTDPAASRDGDLPADAYPRPWRYARVSAALALMFGFYLAVPYVGVPIGGAVVITLFARLLGQRSWWRIAALAILLPTLLYLFFSNVARIPIPLGALESLR